MKFENVNYRTKTQVSQLVYKQRLAIQSTTQLSVAIGVVGIITSKYEGDAPHGAEQGVCFMCTYKVLQ